MSFTRREFLVGTGLFGIGLFVGRTRASNDQIDLARMILDDWERAQPIVEKMSWEERDELIQSVVDVFLSQPSTQQRGINLANFSKTLKWDVDVYDRLVANIPPGGRWPSPAPLGVGLIVIWNKCASSSLNHVVDLHRGCARTLIKCLRETKSLKSLLKNVETPQSDNI